MICVGIGIELNDVHADERPRSELKKVEHLARREAAGNGMRDPGRERGIEGVEVEGDVHRSPMGNVRRVIERNADGSRVKLAQAARVAAGAIGLHRVFGANAVLRKRRHV